MTLIKHSKERLVISGSTYQKYLYDKPYFWNFPPKVGGGATLVHVDTEGKLLVKEKSRRADNLSRCRQKVYRVIQCNISQYNEQSKFATYTFKKNITSVEKAQEHWRNYQKRLYRHLKIRLKYVAVIEFQKRGSIHFHVIYFNLPYIPQIKTILAEVWGHGFINIKTLREVKNVSAYVCKYIQKQFISKKLRKQKAYFTSKNLKKPIEFKKSKNIAKALSCVIIKSSLVTEYSSSKYGRVVYEVGVIN